VIVVDHQQIESAGLSNYLEILTGISGIGKQRCKNFRADVYAAMHPKRRNVDQSTRTHFGRFHFALKVLHEQNTMTGQAIISFRPIGAPMEVAASHEKLRSDFSRTQNTDSGDQVTLAFGESEFIDPVSNFASSTFQQLLKLRVVGIDTIELSNIFHVPSRVRLNFEGFGIQESGKRWQVINGTHGAQV
jgi:hypothetical protein